MHTNTYAHNYITYEQTQKCPLCQVFLQGAELRKVLELRIFAQTAHPNMTNMTSERTDIKSAWHFEINPHGMHRVQIHIPPISPIPTLASIARHVW